MDRDRQDETDFEASDNSESFSDDGGPYANGKSRYRHRSSPIDSRDALGSSRMTRTLKWERLQPMYNDQYQELFREYAETESDEYQSSHYQTSQLGAVVWSSVEKARLFQALPRVGRHNLPRLAECVRTKSEPEIKGYLDRLQSEEADRQLFEKQTKNISYTEIPAAIEIGVDYETRLERAADALAAFQEQYDIAVGQQDTVLPFVVTHGIACQLDEETDDVVSRLDADDMSEDEAISDLDHPHQLFNLRVFIELSETIFMRGSYYKSYDNWRELAEEGESPAITQRVIADFHDLVLSLTRRLLQTTLFLTQSRIRATNTKHRRPTNIVKPGDVYSAVRILNVENDLWDYWTRLPRRHGLKVVSGSHRKGDSDKQILSYDEVEAALSVRHFTGRRRSLSVLSGTTWESGSDREESRSSADNGEPALSSSDTEADVASDSSAAVSEASAPQETTETSENKASTGKQPATSIRVPTSKRKRMLDEELDRHLEEMDQRSRQQEEARLTALLGFEDLGLIKEAPIEPGRRPKVPRKSLQDVEVWTGIHQAEWESHPTSLPDDVSEEQLQKESP